MASNDTSPKFNIVPILSHILQELCLRNDQIENDPKFTNKFYSSRAPPIAIKDYLERIENIHRVIITAIMLAAKFFDDQYYNNSYYSKIGGVTCQEINSLEVEFLFMNNFTLFVPSEIYDQYIEQLSAHARTHQQEGGEVPGKYSFPHTAQPTTSPTALLVGAHRGGDSQMDVDEYYNHTHQSVTANDEHNDGNDPARQSFQSPPSDQVSQTNTLNAQGIANMSISSHPETVSSASLGQFPGSAPTISHPPPPPPRP